MLFTIGYDNECGGQYVFSVVQHNAALFMIIKIALWCPLLVHLLTLAFSSARDQIFKDRMRHFMSLRLYEVLFYLLHWNICSPGSQTPAWRRGGTGWQGCVLSSLDVCLVIVMVNLGASDCVTTFVSNLATVQKLSLFFKDMWCFLQGKTPQEILDKQNRLESVPFTSGIPYAPVL